MLRHAVASPLASPTRWPQASTLGCDQLTDSGSTCSLLPASPRGVPSCLYCLSCFRHSEPPTPLPHLQAPRVAHQAVAVSTGCAPKDRAASRAAAAAAVNDPPLMTCSLPAPGRPRLQHGGRGPGCAALLPLPPPLANGRCGGGGGLPAAARGPAAAAAHPAETRPAFGRMGPSRHGGTAHGVPPMFVRPNSFNPLRRTLYQVIICFRFTC